MSVDVEAAHEALGTTRRKLTGSRVMEIHLMMQLMIVWLGRLLRRFVRS